MNGAQPWLLAIDTATSTIVVAAGSTDGRVIAVEAFEGRYRHSQELLPAVSRVMSGAGLRLGDLAGVVAGTGPGTFTGLRVGLATAKTLAHELDVPVVGISTAEALLAAAASGNPHRGAGGGAAGEAARAAAAAVLWLPSGARDRIAVVAGRPPVVVRGDGAATPNGGGHGAAGRGAGAAARPGEAARTDLTIASHQAAIPVGDEIAIDLPGRASEAALARGREAVSRLPEALLRLGAARLAAGERDAPEQLVPEYASAPRGAPAIEPEGGVAWSRDPR